MPRSFDNGFLNGAPLPGEAAFAPGARLSFAPSVGAAVPILTIPPAPVLTVTEDGAPLDPPVDLVPQVDTIVVDRTAAQFLLVWRASFAWEARLETATLTVH
ncbi:hypothetical protein [Sphingomonas psychrotolerans]|uniref:Uncharacterized protein n=1 Tax=Sphingomonas psychrotolerans TaxID=1327635 RepID=A0A2K8MAK5_9SPHN|nr:hypothetical protein [Sphingomonas psychrotolerans]ATY30912.1 hypothetical protein CVN68_02025 [Sphingomonas psychrotolerans]